MFGMVVDFDHIYVKFEYQSLDQGQGQKLENANLATRT